jgi:protein TonB
MEKVEPAPASQPPAPVETPSPPAVQTTQKAVGEAEPAAAAIVVATPRYSDNPPPAYPSIARKRRYQGTVLLDVLVEKDGQVGDLRVIESSTHTLLDRAAMKAVRRWQFEPGRQGDITIAMWVRVPVQFILK